MPGDQAIAAERARREENARRLVTIWTTGGHVFEGYPSEEQDVEGQLRASLGAAPDPNATIDLRTGDKVVAIVVSHVVAFRFKASKNHSTVVASG